MLLWKVCARSIGFVSMLILARVLTPADFGLVAMAMAVVALTELMSAFGFDAAIIQRQDAQRIHYDTAWTFNVMSGALIALLLFALTIPAAEFYNEPRLHALIPVLATGALITGFENIGVVQFRKEMDFYKEIRFLLLKQVAMFAIAIPCALIFRSYWALVAGTMAGKLISTLASYALHPYRPRFSLAARDDLLHFSKWMFFLNVFVFVQNKSSDFILGRIIGPTAVGLYNVANELSLLPATEMIAPVNRAVFPAYSKLTGDLDELRNRFLDVFGIVALVAFPLSIGLASVAAPAVLLVLGTQWVDAIPLLRLLAIAGLAGALQSNLHLVIIALGKPKTSTLVSMITAIASLPVLVIASASHGVMGAAVTSLVFGLAGLLLINVAFFRLTRFLVDSYLMTLWRPLVSSIVMAAGIVAVSRIASPAIASNLLELLILVSTGALLYSVSVLVLWWMAGLPAGAERTALRFIADRMRRLRPA